MRSAALAADSTSLPRTQLSDSLLPRCRRSSRSLARLVAKWHAYSLTASRHHLPVEPLRTRHVSGVRMGLELRIPDHGLLRSRRLPQQPLEVPLRLPQLGSLCGGVETPIDLPRPAHLPLDTLPLTVSRAPSKPLTCHGQLMSLDPGVMLHQGLL